MSKISSALVLVARLLAEFAHRFDRGVVKNMSASIFGDRWHLGDAMADKGTRYAVMHLVGDDEHGCRFCPWSGSTSRVSSSLSIFRQESFNGLPIILGIGISVWNERRRTVDTALLRLESHFL